MPVIKCKMCGGDMELSPDKTFGTCEYCGSTMTLPKVDDEQRAAAFNRGNHFRRIGEFDKALSVYERIVQEDETDAEAHWCCALCRFGIEYVEDPATYEWLPTCHRASFDSFLEDVDYLAALKYSDGITRRQYQKDGVKIAEVQRGILATSQNEEPFDVFLCYKESDENGNRTVDSTLAQEIYYQLTNQGRRVFFARITLEDKAGAQYEPYIFAALNSAKVMIVVGTKPEYFNAVWVKNEWSRFLFLMKKDRNKLLLPCYRDMDPYDLPEQLSVLQSYDVGKIGFLQDLIRGVSKVLDADKQPVKETVVFQQSGGANTEAIMKRGRMALEDGEWAKADGFFEEVLNQNAECAEAYTGKLLASTQCRTLQEYIQKQLTKTERAEVETLSAAEPNRERIQKAIRCYSMRSYLEEKQISALYTYDLTYPSTLNSRRRQAEEAKQEFDGDKLLRRAFSFAKAEYKENLENVRQGYFSALDARTAHAKEMDIARIEHIRAIYAGFLDKADEEAKTLFQAKAARREHDYQGWQEVVQKDASTIDQLRQAQHFFVSQSEYKNCEALAKQCEKRIADIIMEQQRREAENQATNKAASEQQKAALAKVEAQRKKRKIIIGSLSGFIAVALITMIIVFKTVIIPQKNYEVAEALLTSGDNLGAAYAYGKAGDYKDAREQSADLWDKLAFRETISAGDGHTVGLKSDGTAIAVGANGAYQCEVRRSAWANIVAVSAGQGYTVGLKDDGTVVAVGNNEGGKCSVSRWANIVAISAGDNHTVGLKDDGTVVAVGKKDSDRCSVSDWTNIISVSAGSFHTIGLKADGTVMAVGQNEFGQCDVSNWTDIIAVSAGGCHTIGLKADGTVAAVGQNEFGQCDVSNWTDIIAVSAAGYNTVGLKNDGTVVAVGRNEFGECNVSNWTNIVAVSASDNHTVGLKADGTVVAVGWNEFGECGVSDWTDIKAR